MLLALEAVRCACADVEMEFVKERRIMPFFGESPESTGTVQMFRCPNCRKLIVQVVSQAAENLHPPVSLN